MKINKRIVDISKLTPEQVEKDLEHIKKKFQQNRHEEETDLKKCKKIDQIDIFIPKK